jgi:hypothetical protein
MKVVNRTNGGKENRKIINEIKDTLSLNPSILLIQEFLSGDMSLGE